MGMIKPICLQDAVPEQGERGRFGVIDDFLVVLDGREDLLSTLKTARELIKDPRFQAICIIRDSQTLSESFAAVAGMMEADHKFGYGAKEGVVLPWPEKDRFLFKDKGITSLRSNKSFSQGRADKLIGPDFNQVFMATGIVFPEYLSWEIKRLKNVTPGILHYDEGYSPGRRNILDLPKGFVNSVNAREFDVLEGGLTFSMSLANESTIVCKTDSVFQRQNFYNSENSMTGYQAQNGDLLIMRSHGWDVNQGYQPVFHCPPLPERKLDRRFVALASGGLSYHAPQVREYMGRSRFPIDNPLQNFLDDFDSVSSEVPAQSVKAIFQKLSPNILMDFPLRELDRFPQETKEQILPILEVA